MFTHPPAVLSPQRAGTRRRYHDDGISDEEIDGRRMFDLEEKVHSQRFSSDRVIHMQGKGMKHSQSGFHRWICAIRGEVCQALTVSWLLRLLDVSASNLTHSSQLQFCVCVYVCGNLDVPNSAMNQELEKWNGYHTKTEIDEKTLEHFLVTCWCLCLSDFTYEFIQRSGLRDPILFDKPEGLGIK